MFTDGRTDEQRTDFRLIAISPEPFGRGIIKKGITVVVFKISDLENFASFSTRRYNGVLWKTHFFWDFPLA